MVKLIAFYQIHKHIRLTFISMKELKKWSQERLTFNMMVKLIVLQIRLTFILLVKPIVNKAVQEESLKLDTRSDVFTWVSVWRTRGRWYPVHRWWSPCRPARSCTARRWSNRCASGGPRMRWSECRRCLEITGYWYEFTPKVRKQTMLKVSELSRYTRLCQFWRNENSRRNLQR